MKKVLFIGGILLLSITTFAQKKKAPKKGNSKTTVAVDSTNLLNVNPLKPNQSQSEDYVTASLISKDLSSNKNGQKQYYDSYKITLHAGEEMIIEHQSSDFRVMLGLKSPSKSVNTEFSYDANPFSGNSFNKFHFTAPTTGTYTLLATSMDAGQVGRYSIRKTIYAPNALESKVDATLSKNFKALLASKKGKFKDILGEKIKVARKEKAMDKATGQDKYNTKAELLSGKAGIIVLENEGQSVSYKSVLLESENEEDVKNQFQQLVKQFQILTRSWLEQPSTELSYSASTDQDMVSLNISSTEDKKKKKKLYQLNFSLN
ncbi:hypothetical protein [Cellulophaga sp. BC115SP]|uniref:hypothetical protein n=1 Tax=Cellulophaga sp. BC115SP TaxID=2683263 RepID=UPI001411CC1A|nr:hypothetical protein [Cellulophaga sp. BC115SP]NBB26680.1 hypothetical protein [Cellulophaga sp. BC115SP]